MASKFPLIKRLGLAVGVLALAGCAALPQETHGSSVVPPPVPPASVAPPSSDWVVNHTPNYAFQNYRASAEHFGSVDPRPPGTGSLDAASAAGEKLDAARATQYVQPWMITVTRINRAAELGRGSVLTTGVDPQNPTHAARDMVRLYNQLADMVWDSNIGQRQNNIRLVTRAYEETLLARQNTAMLLQADPSLRNLVQYARLEGARRVIGKVLAETGTMAGSDVRGDYASTYGLLTGTGIALNNVREGRFGLDEVQMTNDQNQRGALTRVGQIEQQYMADVARSLAPDIQSFVQHQQYVARTGDVTPGTRLERRLGGY